METGTGGLNFHDGSVTPTYLSLCKSKKLFERLAAKIEDRSFEAAIVLDYDDYFMLYSTPKGHGGSDGNVRTQVDYFHDMLYYYQTLLEAGLSCTFVRKGESLEGYKLVIAHEKWIMDEVWEKAFREYVASGGVLIGADRFGTHTVNGRMSCVPLPGNCVDLFGVYFNEYFSPKREGGSVKLVWEDILVPVIRQISPLESRGAELLACIKGGSYSGLGAVSVNCYGVGRAYYIGALLELDGVRGVLYKILKREGLIRPLPVMEPMPDYCEVIERGKITAIFNNGVKTVHLSLTKGMKELVTEEEFNYITIEPMDCKVFEKI